MCWFVCLHTASRPTHTLFTPSHIPIHICTPLTHLTHHPAVLSAQPGPFSSFLSVFSHLLTQPQSLLLRTNKRTKKLSLSLLVCGVTIQLSLFVGLQERREEGKGSKSSSQTFLLSLAFFQAFLCEMGTDLAWNPIPALLHSHKATLSSP